MIWYNIIKNNDKYYLWKNVEIGNGIAFKGIFSGTRIACEKYCEDNSIKLGKKNKQVIQ